MIRGGLGIRFTADSSMVVREIVDRHAPRGVEVVREIDPENQPTYRHAPTARDRILLRVDERPEGHRPMPFLMLLAGPLALLGFAGAVMLGRWELLLGATILFWAAAVFEERHRLGAGKRRPSFGYFGTFRLEDHWLHSPSPANHRRDVATDLARIENVHVVGTECGSNLVVEMRDGEVVDVAIGIADVEVARYLASRINEAAASKR